MLLGDNLKLLDTAPETVSAGAGLAKDIKLLKLHGNMKQNERLQVFQDFRKSPSGVLLCTDVAARGLDLPQVDWIVQYTPPVSVADYVHRVGRTARIGAKGSSVIFLLPSEAEFVKMLESSKIPLAEMTLEMVLGKLMKSGVTGSQGRRPNSMEEAATNLQMRIESAVVRSEVEVKNGVYRDQADAQFASEAPVRLAHAPRLATRKLQNEYVILVRVRWEHDVARSRGVQVERDRHSGGHDALHSRVGHPPTLQLAGQSCLEHFCQLPACSR